MGFDIEPLLQYGVLGIIAWVFLNQSKSMFEKQQKQFELLINTLIKQKEEPLSKVQEGITMLTQLIHSQYKQILDSNSELTSEIEKSLEQKEDMWKIFMDHEARSKERTIEFINLLNSQKLVLLEMKKNCGLAISPKRIGDRLLEKGYITQNQLIEVLEEQEKEEMQQLNLDIKK
jgi:Mg2+ and Co2+ transporter CorA